MRIAKECRHRDRSISAPAAASSVANYYFGQILTESWFTLFQTFEFGKLHRACRETLSKTEIYNQELVSNLTAGFNMFSKR